MSPIRTLQLMLTLIMLFIVAGITLNATTYYVANNGSDSNNGTSTSTPWKTIMHINSQTFLPGDSILFKHGDTWRDTPLQVPSSGNAEHPIVFGAYGEGARPEILGSIEVTTWTNVSGNIWASTITVPEDPWNVGYDGPEIFFERSDQSVSWGIHQTYSAGFSNLMAEYHWTWNNNTIYIYSSKDPNVEYSAAEAPQEPRGIMLMDNNYITIDGLAVKYFADSGIYDEYATIELYGLRVTNCEIAYIGKKEGDAAYGLSVHHSNSYYAYNEIHNCGRRGISITLYDTNPITQSNVIIEHNHFHHGWHTTSLDCSTSAAHVVEKIIFRNNLVEGDPNVDLGINPNSNHVFMAVQGAGDGTIRDIYFNNNIFTYAHASSIKISALDNVFICNNTFFNFNPTLTNWQAHAYCSNSTNITILNNIFCNNANTNMWAAIECSNSTVNELTVNHNLYYNDDPGRRMFWVDGGTSYDVEEWDAYRTATGNDADSPTPASPNFINQPVNFGLNEGSPAIGTGTVIDWIDKDYYGSSMSNPPDIGAIQFGSVASLFAISKNNSLKVYPNPAKDYCVIALSSKETTPYRLRIFNLQGKQVYESKQLLSEEEVTISLKQFNQGIYIITKGGSKLTGFQKLIIGE